MDFEKIFLGSVRPDLAAYITQALIHLRPRYNQVVIPCAGAFTLAKAAMSAGFAAQEIIASDISLFSSLLGYYYSGKSLADLPFEVTDPALKDEYYTCATDTDRLALLLYFAKMGQFRPDILFEQRYADALAVNHADYRKHMAKSLETYRQRYQGIAYKIEDLRAVTACNDPGTILLINPPAYAGGYAKMFKGLTSATRFHVDIPQWSWSKEYLPFYQSLEQLSSTAFMIRIKSASAFDPSHVVYATERSFGRFDHWLCTKPRVLEQFKYTAAIKKKPPKTFRPYKRLAIFGDTDRLTPDSTVSFIKVGMEHCLYYRDLWAHRLGDTKSEAYMLCLIDGKLFAVVGFHSQKVRLGLEQHIFESFGFGCPHVFYRNTTRLLMYLITTEAFWKILRHVLGRNNRLYTVKGIKTTCLTKYRKVKLNNGILPITRREKITKGPYTDMYRLVYQVDWYKRTFAECITRYLCEQTSQAKETGGPDEP